MSNFILTGVAGYIAPRHLKAIYDTGNNLLAVSDPHDSVGIIDRYFPHACYFKEFERFDRHISKLQKHGEKIDYLSVCSSNFLHDAHIMFGLRIGAKVICEKPLVINAYNCLALNELVNEYKGEVNCIMQLRLHPEVQKLKKMVDESGKRHKVELTYSIMRGSWYHFSWKGDESKSGGLMMNIGIHFFDILLWIFGAAESIEDVLLTKTSANGFLKLEKADVRWKLSIDEDTNRSLLIDGESCNFNDGFTDLHTKSYEEILAGRGFPVSDCYPSIKLVNDIKKNFKVL